MAGSSGERNVVLLATRGAGRGATRQGKRLRAQAGRFLAQLRLHGVELSLSLVRDRAIRALNLRWRELDQATDVLSFPAGPSPSPGLAPLGDVVISLETARRRARELGTSLDEELSLYLAHGLLHLLGYDHHAAGDERTMRRKERALLGGEGMLARSARR